MKNWGSHEIFQTFKQKSGKIQTIYSLNKYCFLYGGGGGVKYLKYVFY